MVIIDCIRFARGSVRFEIQKGFVERFINLCAAQGLPLWDGRRLGGVYSARTTPRSYRKMRACAKRAGVRLHITEKDGLPFVGNKYRRRVGLLAGAGVFLAAVLVLSQFVWSIQVAGNSRVATEELVAHLQELGVKPGAFRPGLDTRDIERQMLLRVKELGWIAVNLKGSTAYIEIDERVEPPALIATDVPTNVVASQAGQIRRVTAYNGETVVVEGQVVLPGEVVVSGVMDTKTSGSRLVHARAQVLAQCEERLTVTVPLSQKVLEPVGVERGGSVRIFGLELHLWPLRPPAQPCKREQAASPLTVLGMSLPLEWVRTNYILQRQTTVEYSLDQAQEEAQRQLEILEQQLSRELGEGEILDRSLTGREEAGAYTLTAQYQVLKDIAKEVEIFTN